MLQFRLSTLMKKTQSGESANDRVGAELQWGEQHRLILANMLWSQPVWAAMIILTEVLDAVNKGPKG